MFRGGGMVDFQSTSVVQCYAHLLAQHSWKGFPSASYPFPNLQRLAGECAPPGEMTGGM